MKDPASFPEPQEFWTTRRLLLALGLLVLAIFPKVVLGGTTFFFHDYGALGYPGAAWFQQSLLHSELPLWNPYSHCGVPFLAQMGSWYLPNWLFFLLPLPWGENLCLLAHLVLGGWGMYKLLRGWGITGFAASFAAVAYMFNGVSFSCFQWGNYIASLGWLPWVILANTRAWQTGGRWIGWAALASALQVLTGTPELTLLVWLFLAALWVMDLFAGRIRLGRATFAASAVLVIAAGLTMVQMLPFFDLLANSQREANTASHAQWAMPGWGWANLIVPLFHCYLSPQGNWFQHDQDFLMSYYPGLGVLVLAAIGAWTGPMRLRLVFVAAVLACWVLALGEAGYVYPLAKKIFPWIGIARYPVKFTILPSFLVPVLAAWGIHSIQTSFNSRVRTITFACTAGFVAIAAGLTLFARQNPLPFDEVQAMTANATVRILLLAALIYGLYRLAAEKIVPYRIAYQFGILAILLADLLTQCPGIVPTLPSSVMAPGLWQADGKTGPTLGAGRIMSSPAAERQMLYSYVKDHQLDFLGHRLAEWYNLNLLDSLPKVNGAFTLRPAHFDLVERRIYYTTNSTYGDGLLDFLSAAWISDATNPAKWIARSNPLPVITAGQRPEFKSDPEALDAITATNFDPRAVVYLPETAHPIVTVSNQTACTISNVRFTPNRVEAQITAEAPSLVVIGQTFYHRWQAELDGQPIRLWRANVAFQAVQVPAGQHQLQLIYHDPDLLLGALISAISLGICLVIIGACRERIPQEDLIAPPPKAA